MKKLIPAALMAAFLILAGCEEPVAPPPAPVPEAPVPQESAPEVEEYSPVADSGPTVPQSTPELPRPTSCEAAITLAKAGTAFAYDGQCHDEEWDHYTLSGRTTVYTDGTLVWPSPSIRVDSVVTILGHDGVTGRKLNPDSPAVECPDNPCDMRVIEGGEWALVGDPPPPFVSIAHEGDGTVREGLLTRFHITATDAFQDVTTVDRPRKPITVRILVYKMRNPTPTTIPSLSLNYAIPAPSWETYYTLSPGTILPLDNNTPDPDLWVTVAVGKALDGTYQVVGDWETARIRVVDPEDDPVPEPEPEPDLTRDYEEDSVYKPRVKWTDMRDPAKKAFGRLYMGWLPPEIGTKLDSASGTEPCTGGLSQAWQDNPTEHTDRLACEPVEAYYWILKRGAVTVGEGFTKENGLRFDADGDPVLPTIQANTTYTFQARALYKNAGASDEVEDTQTNGTVPTTSAVTGRLVVTNQPVSGYLGPWSKTVTGISTAEE